MEATITRFLLLCPAKGRNKRDMSAAADCSCACPTPTVVAVPGSPGEPGAPGTDGTNGVNAFTVLSADLLIPVAPGPVVAATSVAVSSWMAIDQIIFISDGTNWGHFKVLTIPGSQTVTLEWLNYPGDSAAGSTISIVPGPAIVSPAGVLSALAAPLPTALTDNSTGTASNTIAAGVGVFTLALAFDLATLTAAASELLTNYVPGYAFKILAVDFVVTKVGAGAGASMTINLEIGAVNVTGGVVNPTLGNTTPQGALVAGTAVTAANVGTATDTLSVEVAAGGTIFTAGTGCLLIKIQNMDSANAIASLADHVNDLITSLT